MFKGQSSVYIMPAEIMGWNRCIGWNYWGKLLGLKRIKRHEFFLLTTFRVISNSFSGLKLKGGII